MKMEELTQMAMSAIEASREEWFGLWEAQRDDGEMNRIMKADWEASPRDSDEAVIDYYRTSKMWFVNTFAHGYRSCLALVNNDRSILSLPDWQVVFKQYLPKGNPILDYGGGFWNDTALLALDGYPVTQAEIEGSTTRMLEMVKAATPMKQFLNILPVTSGFPLTGVYYGVVCFEVLEHLLDPRKFTEHLRDHMNGGSPMALSVSFGAPEHAPYHVAANEPLGRDGVWNKTMEEMEFTKIWRGEAPERTVWRKK
jgi:hypothetical protein